MMDESYSEIESCKDACQLNKSIENTDSEPTTPSTLQKKLDEIVPLKTRRNNLIAKNYKKKNVKMAAMCEHADAPQYSNGVCKKCYLRNYYINNRIKKKKTKLVLKKKKTGQSLKLKVREDGAENKMRFFEEQKTMDHSPTPEQPRQMIKRNVKSKDKIQK